jgi:molecular chaperone GrpE
MSESEANVRGHGPFEDDRGSEAAPPVDSPEPDGELVEMTRQRDEYLDALQRLKAEFDNFRKRIARDQESSQQRATEQLVKQLVPVLDDLERALEAATESPVPDSGPVEGVRGNREVPPVGDATLLDGVRLVHRALSDALARAGLVEVSTEGRFDPHTQEALLAQPSEHDEGQVIQVLQKGYKLGDHVLRPARVVVSAGADNSPSAPGAEL